MNIKSHQGIIFVLAGALLLSGCRAAFPTGKFSSTRDTVSRYLIFYPDGRWEGFQDGNMLTFGAYTTDGDRVQFETDFQCQDLGLPQAADYGWKYADNTLTFQPAGEDGCSARAEFLSGAFRRSQ